MVTNSSEKMTGGVAVLVILCFLLAPFIRAYCLAKLWLWFLVPTLHVAPIGMAMAFGIFVTIRLFTYVPPLTTPRESRPLAERTAAMLTDTLAPLFALLAGYVLTCIA